MFKEDVFDNYPPLIKKILKESSDGIESLNEIYQLLLSIRIKVKEFYTDKNILDYTIKISKYCHEMCDYMAASTGKAEYDSLYWKFVLFEAQNYQVDSGLLYLERYRDPEDQFYMPRRKQFIEFGLIQGLQDMIDDKIDILSLSLPPGVGKAQPLYSKVLTPNGFVDMGDVRIGDTVISGEGRSSKVIGVYPQGIKKIYEITFDDGSKARCSDEHLWKVQTRDDRKKNKYRVIELKNMLKNLYVENEKRSNYSIDYVAPVKFCAKKELKIHPYILGVILGDGCITKNNVKIYTPDTEIISKVSRLFKGDRLVKFSDIGYRIVRKEQNGRGRYSEKSETRKALDYYKLYGAGSFEKFIPNEYLLADLESRIELLKGLLDTDGYSYGTGIEYTTVSEKLKDGIIDLVHSLGGYASVSPKQGKYKKDGKVIICKMAYRIIIQFPSTFENPFSLKRKSDNYNPKRKEIKRFIKKIEYIGEEECQCIMIDDPCHLYITDNYVITHNTTLGELFVSLFIGWFPDTCNLFSSHSGHVTRMVYDVVSNIIGINLKKGQIPEYAWREIFPNVQFESCNANEQTINLGKFKPFKSLTCRALGASQTGVTRAEGILYCDDLCSGIEQALSKIRLDKLWTMYSTDLKTRKKKGKKGRTCKELHIATRWSVWDVIGRIKSIYDGNKRCRFISIPDINPKTGESNFDFLYGVGFDKAYFEDIQKSLDEITYKCLYKNEPVEREGILYNPDLLTRAGDLPPREPDGIWAFCDTKDTGTDYNCLGVFYQYGKDFYLWDVVFKNIDPYLLDDINADCLVRNKVHIAVFESNKEGSRTADKVQEKVKEKGGRCSIQKRYTTQNKETKIIVNSPWVIEHIIFRQPKSEDYPDGYDPQSDYGKFMSWLCAWSQLSKNPHDDAPDMVSMCAVYMQNGIAKPAQIISSPF